MSTVLGDFFTDLPECKDCASSELLELPLNSPICMLDKLLIIFKVKMTRSLL